MALHIFVDGASRGNPGKAGFGVYGFDTQTRETVISEGAAFGVATNNVAEYGGLALALHIIKEMSWTGKVVVHADSKLMVNQFNGLFRVKNPELQKWFSIVKLLSYGLDLTVTHVRREKNTQADALANQGVDLQTIPPASFIAFLKRNNISTPF